MDGFDRLIRGFVAPGLVQSCQRTCITIRGRQRWACLDRLCDVAFAVSRNNASQKETLSLSNEHVQNSSAFLRSQSRPLSAQRSVNIKTHRVKTKLEKN